MNKMRKIAALCMLMLMFTCAGILLTHVFGSTTWFVATAGGGGSDSNNCATSGTPCLTFNHAYSVASAGDFVSVANGTYGAQTISATAKASAVTFFSATSGSPGSCGRVFQSACPVTVASIDVQTSFVTIQNVNSTGPCTAAPANLANSPTTVTHNTFTGVSCEGWFIVGQDILVNMSNTGPYDACTQDAAEDGVDIWQNNSGVASTRITFDQDDIHDVSDHGNECGTGTHIDGMQILAGHFITVTRSRFWNNATSDIIARPFNDTLDNLDFENNYMQEVVTPGAALNLGSSGDSIGGTNKVWYNRIESASVVFGTGTVGIKGNILATGSCQTGGVYDHNVFNPSFSATCGTNGKKAAPSFVGPTPAPAFNNGIVPNYALQSGDTVAKDWGDPSNFPATDIVGTARPQGSAPDAGAFEIPSGGGGAPAAPTNVTATVH